MNLISCKTVLGKLLHFDQLRLATLLAHCPPTSDKLTNHPIATLKKKSVYYLGTYFKKQ